MKNFLAVDTSGNHLAVIAVKNGKKGSVYIELGVLSGSKK